MQKPTHDYLWSALFVCVVFIWCLIDLGPPEREDWRPLIFVLAANWILYAWLFKVKRWLEKFLNNMFK